jgi:methylated-DNA-[protein]-cysteine S-methyltransferase
MQTWHVESALLGVLKIKFDENVVGFNSLSVAKSGAIVSIDMMQRIKPFEYDSKEFRQFVKCLNAYESGRLGAFEDLSLQITGTDFQKLVLSQMRKIPAGTVSTYSDLAKAAGSAKAFRAVATICATNRIPLLIPCHRVVPSDLSVGQYAARTLKNGSRLKESLLEHEGAIS